MLARFVSLFGRYRCASEIMYMDNLNLHSKEFQKCLEIHYKTITI
jgi:hypothetical protein